MIEKLKRKIRLWLGVQIHQLDLELVEVHPKKLVGDTDRFTEFKKVITNEYINHIRAGKMAEATAMDKLYGKLEEIYDSIYAVKKNIPLDPIMKMQVETQKMIENNSLDS